jgi:hypothetical protein
VETDELIAEHYRQQWVSSGTLRRLTSGPMLELLPSFGVREIEVTPTCWVYGTSGMAQLWNPKPLELFLYSPVEDPSHVELLTFIAHYHHTGAPLGEGHTVNFGRPWLPGSLCDHGLISLPYDDGPELENLMLGTLAVRCLWLIPITRAEREFKREHGLEALESMFDSANLKFIFPGRRSVVD